MEFQVLRRRRGGGLSARDGSSVGSVGVGDGFMSVVGTSIVPYAGEYHGESDASPVCA